MVSEDDPLDKLLATIRSALASSDEGKKLVEKIGTLLNARNAIPVKKLQSELHSELVQTEAISSSAAREASMLAFPDDLEEPDRDDEDGNDDGEERPDTAPFLFYDGTRQTLPPSITVAIKQEWDFLKRVASEREQGALEFLIDTVGATEADAKRYLAAVDSILPEVQASIDSITQKRRAAASAASKDAAADSLLSSSSSSAGSSKSSSTNNKDHHKQSSSDSSSGSSTCSSDSVSGGGAKGSSSSTCTEGKASSKGSGSKGADKPKPDKAGSSRKKKQRGGGGPGPRRGQRQ